MKRVLITGSSGYFGGKLVTFLRSKPEIEVIVGTDIRPPDVQYAKLTFYERDVRQSCEDLLRKHEVDTVIHTAWIFAPDSRQEKDGGHQHQRDEVNPGLRSEMGSAPAPLHEFHHRVRVSSRQRQAAHRRESTSRKRRLHICQMQTAC